MEIAQKTSQHQEHRQRYLVNIKGGIPQDWRHENHRFLDDIAVVTGQSHAEDKPNRGNDPTLAFD